jgi:broad-specificity NMP kinase
MKDIGTYQGTAGLEKLLQEINNILANKKRAVIAIAGLPGSGKTYMVKRFVRLGFGKFGRKDILVIDDNIIYSTRFWRLKWEKIKIDKQSSESLRDSTAAKVIFFSNWIPSRFLASADVYVILQLSENERLKRLRYRERKAPEKFQVQKNKDLIPMEEPFECPKVMTLVNHSGGMYRWHCMWVIRRIFSCRKETQGL